MTTSTPGGPDRSRRRDRSRAWHPTVGTGGEDHDTLAGPPPTAVQAAGDSIIRHPEARPEPERLPLAVPQPRGVPPIAGTVRRAAAAPRGRRARHLGPAPPPALMSGR